MGKCLYTEVTKFFPLICIANSTKLPHSFEELKITIKRLVGTACGVYIPHMSKVGEGKEYPVDHFKSEYEEV